MINVATETNIDLLRQVAVLLERENSRLHQRLQHLTAELARAQGKDADTLQLEIEHLKETLARQNRALFGTSSEKRKNGDGQSRAEAVASKPQRGHGPVEQKALPIFEEVHDLDQADKHCRDCGGELVEMAGQFEQSDEIDVVERSFRIARHKRKKYRCRCGSSVETAPGPAKLITGGRYSVDFAVGVAMDKYGQHLPLARQVRQMEREGLVVTTQTLWDQLFALSAHLKASYQQLRDLVLSAPVLGADETTWQLMGNGGSQRWWAWSISSTEAIYHQIHAKRSLEATEAILGEYKGVVVCDGYTTYGAMVKKRQQAREGPAPPELAHCWSHVRRKFFEAEPHDKRAGQAIELIGKLFAVEAEVQQVDAAERRARCAELREQRSRPTIEEFHQWMLAQRALPRSSLGRAIHYTDGMWKGLCRFLENPDIPIHNNGAERGLRGIALGRKNHYGSRSQRGTEVAALFYSLVESANLIGMNPAMYLREATRRAIAAPGTATLPRDLL